MRRKKEDFIALMKCKATGILKKEDVSNLLADVHHMGNSFQLR